MRNLKNTKGITLVALIITIIVLLILAMVSISLVINSGIITKSKTSVDKYSEEEIGEQLKLAYSGYQMAVYSEGANNATTFVKTRLKSTFGNSLDEDSVSVTNGKVSATINNKKYQYDASTGIAGEYVEDPIKYYDSSDNEITKTDTTHLDYLIIGGTEKFKVISITNGILAMPYYNLVTVNADNTVKQGPAVEGTSTEISSPFSESRYWTQGDDAIDMTDSIIQDYITKYETTLEGLGAEGVTVRAAKYSELSASGVTNAMKNPGQTGDFWLCSGHPYNADYVRYVHGSFGVDSNTYNSSYGVRPIIEIH